MSRFVADQTFDAVAFLEAAEKVCRRKGVFDEDLPSAMLLEALELRERSPGTLLNILLLFSKGYEQLHPRGGDGKGGRARKDALDHCVPDTIVMQSDGEEIRRTECAVISLTDQFTAASSNNLRGVARRATGDLQRAKYLSRFAFGHLPFVI